MQTYAALSGGKDSIAQALLMPDATLVFADTQWEFPQLYDHLDKFERVTGREIVRIKHPDWPGGLKEYIRHYAFLPGHGARFCTRIFKIEAFNLWLADKLPAELSIALRADEPEEERVGNLTDIPDLIIRYPLREQGYKIADVIKLDLAYDLLPRFPVFMARGGCIGCFYKRKSEVLAMAHLAPLVLDELQELEEEIQRERGKFVLMFPNAGCSIREIRRQMLLFKPEEVWQDAGDRSDYGQACGLFCHR